MQKRPILCDYYTTITMRIQVGVDEYLDWLIAKTLG